MAFHQELIKNPFTLCSIGNRLPGEIQFIPGPGGGDKQQTPFFFHFFPGQPFRMIVADGIKNNGPFHSLGGMGRGQNHAGIVLLPPGTLSFPLLIVIQAVFHHFFQIGTQIQGFQKKIKDLILIL